jgi:hypothetical protein
MQTCRQLVKPRTVKQQTKRFQEKAPWRTNRIMRPRRAEGCSVDVDRTPTHGYEPTREAGMSLISLNVRFQGQPGPHLLAVSFSQFDR